MYTYVSNVKAEINVTVRRHYGDDWWKHFSKSIYLFGHNQLIVFLYRSNIIYGSNARLILTDYHGCLFSKGYFAWWFANQKCCREFHRVQRPLHEIQKGRAKPDTYWWNYLFRRCGWGRQAGIIDMQQVSIFGHGFFTQVVLTEESNVYTFTYLWSFQVVSGNKPSQSHHRWHYCA